MEQVLPGMGYATLPKGFKAKRDDDGAVVGVSKLVEGPGGAKLVDAVPGDVLAAKRKQDKKAGAPLRALMGCFAFCAFPVETHTYSQSSQPNVQPNHNQTHIGDAVRAGYSEKWDAREKSSEFKGVSYDEATGKWRAKLCALSGKLNVGRCAWV